MYSFRLLLSGKLLMWPFILIENLAGYSLGCRPLVLITWNIFCHSLLAWSFSIEKSVANLIGAPWYVTSFFSLAAFKILSLSWKFAILITMCLAVGLFGFLLLGTLCVSWICVTFSLIKLGKFPSLLFQTGFLSLVLLFLLVSLLYRYYYVSCCPAFPLIPLHSF